MKLPTARQIASALSEAKFNPKLPGPMHIIADQGSPEYYLLRANEFISEIRGDSKINEDAINKLNKAMGLLALVKVHYSEQLQSKKAAKSRPKEPDLEPNNP